MEVKEIKIWLLWPSIIRACVHRYVQPFYAGAQRMEGRPPQNDLGITQDDHGNVNRINGFHEGLLPSRLMSPLVWQESENHIKKVIGVALPVCSNMIQRATPRQYAQSRNYAQTCKSEATHIQDVHEYVRRMFAGTQEVRGYDCMTSTVTHILYPRVCLQMLLSTTIVRSSGCNATDRGLQPAKLSIRIQTISATLYHFVQLQPAIQGFALILINLSSPKISVRFQPTTT